MHLIAADISHVMQPTIFLDEAERWQHNTPVYFAAACAKNTGLSDPALPVLL